MEQSNNNHCNNYMVNYVSIELHTLSTSAVYGQYHTHSSKNESSSEHDSSVRL